MIAVLAILGFVATGLAIGLVAISRAPHGYQDETGFHYGPEEAKSAKQAPVEKLPVGVPRPKLA